MLRILMTFTFLIFLVTGGIMHNLYGLQVKIPVGNENSQIGVGGLQGNSPSGLEGPESMRVNSSWIVICDTVHSQIKVFDRKGTFYHEFNTPEFYELVSADFVNSNQVVAVDRELRGIFIITLPEKKAVWQKIDNSQWKSNLQIQQIKAVSENLFFVSEVLSNKILEVDSGIIKEISVYQGGGLLLKNENLYTLVETEKRQSGMITIPINSDKRIPVFSEFKELKKIVDSFLMDVVSEKEIIVSGREGFTSDSLFLYTVKEKENASLLKFSLSFPFIPDYTEEKELFYLSISKDEKEIIIQSTNKAEFEKEIK